MSVVVSVNGTLKSATISPVTATQMVTAPISSLTLNCPGCRAIAITVRESNKSCVSNSVGQSQ